MYALAQLLPCSLNLLFIESDIPAAVAVVVFLNSLFCRSQLKRKKVIASHTPKGKYTFEILQSYGKFHTGQIIYVIIYLTAFAKTYP